MVGTVASQCGSHIVPYFAADLLQNPDFENPPTNVTVNSTSQFLLLNKSSNSIPGWSFNGTVWYVTSGGNLSLPRNGLAVQLGENGKIRQTVRGIEDEYSDYILTFSLVVQNEYCANNRTAVNISVHDTRSSIQTSKVFVLEKNLSRNLWASYGLFLGSLGKGDSVNIEIKSTTVIATNSVQNNNNVSCWPIVDAFRVKRNDSPRWYSGIYMFVKLLNNITIGSIPYPVKGQGNKEERPAIQLLSSGAPSGIQMDLTFPVDNLSYTLNFTIGDANDSCVGDLMLYVQIGNEVHNFTTRSIGTGSAFHHFIAFKAVPTVQTSIIFYSFDETGRSDGVLCGPVLDNVVLLASYGERVEIMYNIGVLILSLFLALVILLM
ncbi:hypothetical protein BUALT_Bualt17G0019200 [Buddleja alternifolia]|uniref:DUF642 domain-containing protein n=1 Tax=Buddleja alternifolia TaxID=168488 RepID=A0AAV6WBM0_9LAMI|nr:hypothetical protein BUALT_Bualt17G0019200 [Buddleja alternifolia]